MTTSRQAPRANDSSLEALAPRRTGTVEMLWSVALVQCVRIVGEREMVRATDHDAWPSVSRQTIVNRSNVGPDLAAIRVGRYIAVVAQEEHERLVDPCLNDAAHWSTVNIDAGLTPGIVVAEL